MHNKAVNVRLRLDSFKRGFATKLPITLALGGFGSMRMTRMFCLSLIPLLVSCSSPATNCLDLAPIGIWTKIEPPRREIVELFGTPHEGSIVLWFKNREGRYGMCQSCSASDSQAKSFLVGREKLEPVVEQACAQ
jgi:hypothetical protein